MAGTAALGSRALAAVPGSPTMDAPLMASIPTSLMREITLSAEGKGLEVLREEDAIGRSADLVVVLGGDGSIISAARTLSGSPRRKGL